MKKTLALWLLLLLPYASMLGQPTATGDSVVFLYCNPFAKTVALLGDFNGWSKTADIMQKVNDSLWRSAKSLLPGIYQYKFLVDDTLYVLDPANPAAVENFNRTSKNSVLTVTDSGKVAPTTVEGYQRQQEKEMSDVYPITGKTIYLNIIWHQHQPLYLDPEKDQLQGPWVRTHGTKDYYDMAAMLKRYPFIHVTINLTSSLLLQLQTYYVDRLRDFVDVKKNRVDAERFLKKYGGKTDPWIDIALKPAGKLSASDRAYLYKKPWNAFGISEVMLSRFPEYEALKNHITAQLRKGKEDFSVEELRELKFWFFLAYFDPEFLQGPVRLPDGSICDLSDYVDLRADGKYYLKKKITEADCNRIVAETYKVLSNIVPVHRQLMYHAETKQGQIELITTPYYHPILPLIYDSDIARTCQPRDSLPRRYHHPEDAFAQVAKSVSYFKSIFGSPPSGMWPAEGSVAQEVIPIFAKNKVQWIATDEKILRRSKPPNQPLYYPYGAGKPETGWVLIVFRDTELSDRIGFRYQNYYGEEAADDFIKYVLRFAPRGNEPDRLLTVILDGENAWEWYRYDNDGKEFLNALYRKLTRLFHTRQIVTVTPSEYISGNAERGVPPHPIKSLPRLEWLWPGSWINADFDTWIGEDEENRAWDYLGIARDDLAKSGVPQPDPSRQMPVRGTKAWAAWMAWEELYAAEGSDWFWWYGEDQNAPGGDEPFDIAFRNHLNNIYRFARMSGGKMPRRTFPSILKTRPLAPLPSIERRSVMAQSKPEMVKVIFMCDARGLKVPDAIYIAGNRSELGEWKPNIVRMYDDGTHGDERAHDGIWSLEVDLPVGAEIHYKYTNSGRPGIWSPGEEFPALNRSFVVNGNGASQIILRDTFGKM